MCLKHFLVLARRMLVRRFFYRELTCKVGADRLPHPPLQPGLLPRTPPFPGELAASPRIPQPPRPPRTPSNPHTPRLLPPHPPPGRRNI